MTAGVSVPLIQLIVGLGNPGVQYDGTRHNAGFWFINKLAQVYGASLLPEKKFFGQTASISINEQSVRLFNPSTFMNCSGKAVSSISIFFKIPLQSILVVHDDLDLPPGISRLKRGGGHGGHNGLRDIISSFGNCRDFQRLRIGIGHPGNSKLVVNYVLHPPSVHDRQRMDIVIDEAVRITPEIIKGSWQKAMQELHSFSN